MKIIRFLFALAAMHSLCGYGQIAEGITLLNMAGRGMVTAEYSLIAGFILTTPRRVLVRAAGPGVPRIANYCRDPSLTVFKKTVAIAVNEDWDDNASTRAVFASAGAFPFAPQSKDCAVILDLEEGEYTAVVTCSPGNEGVALVEVYDLNSYSPGGLKNLSLRGRAAPGEGALIAGIVMGGRGQGTFMFRATGPGLEQFGVKDFLPDPKLVIRDPSGTFTWENDNWLARSSTFFTTQGMFAVPVGSLDAALVWAVGSEVHVVSAITAVAEDTQGRPGTALVEVFRL